MDWKRAKRSWAIGAALVVSMIPAGSAGLPQELIERLLVPGFIVAAQLGMGRDDAPILVILLVSSVVYGSAVYVISLGITKLKS
jgi:hypothetical protein